PNILITTHKEGSVSNRQGLWLIDDLPVEKFRKAQRRLREVVLIQIGNGPGKIDLKLSPCDTVRLPGSLWRKNGAAPQLVTFVAGKEIPAFKWAALDEAFGKAGPLTLEARRGRALSVFSSESLSPEMVERLTAIAARTPFDNEKPKDVYSRELEAYLRAALSFVDLTGRHDWIRFGIALRRLENICPVGRPGF